MTRFDDLKQNLTPEKLANMTVKLVVINNTELFYITTSGQLYPMNSTGLQAAINHELSYWNTVINKDSDQLKIDGV